MMKSIFKLPGSKSPRRDKQIAPKTRKVPGSPRFSYIEGISLATGESVRVVASLEAGNIQDTMTVTADVTLELATRNQPSQ